MKLKKIIFCIILFSFSASIIAQKAAHFADSIRIVYDIPEISYAVIDKKTTFEIAALGKHSINLPDTASLNDRFHIGSNTKAMTAFIIAKYVENGKLKWTDKFFDLFPEWLNKSRPDYARITLQDLLSHQAGIQPFQGIGDEDPIIPEFTGTQQDKRKQFGQFVLTLDPENPNPERPFVYSNAGYTLAALMLEKASGKSWEQLVEKVFNTDLNLHVKLSWPENQKQKDTWGHSFADGKLTPVASDTYSHLDYTEPSGDLNITLTDYIKFIQLHLQGLNGEDNYLKAETYQFILKGIDNYSLGWFNIKEGNKEFSTHTGTAGTYYSTVQIDRINNKGYVIFTNSFSPSTQEGVRLLMRKLKEVYTNADEKLKITHLADNFYIYTTYNNYQGSQVPANGMYLVTNNSVVLFDTPWDTTQFQPLLDSIQLKHHKNVAMCIATHWHNDRTAGLEYYKQHQIKTYTTVLTDNLCKKNNAKRAEFLISKDTLFHVDQYSFETYFPGEGHTADNIVIWFNKEKILYGGCLIKGAEAENLGYLGDANVSEYATTLQNVQKKYPDPKYIIISHSDWKNINSLKHSLKLARKLKKKRLNA